jgi:DNA-binding CsgD family transcriptional regulator
MGTVENGFTEIDIRSALHVFNMLPDYYCWKGLDLNYVMLNDATARLFGFQSSSVSFQQISDHDLKCEAAALAAQFQQDDNYVLQTGNDLTIFNFCKYGNSDWRLMFGRKSLLYGENNQKKGVYGRFLDVTHCPTFKMILGICVFDQNNLAVNSSTHNQVTYVVKDRFDEYNLSARESEIIFHLIRGRSAKEIAAVTNLSSRTVEKHLDRIKVKMQCYSKSQLIEKSWSLGLCGYLPTSIVGGNNIIQEAKDAG